MSSRLNNIDLNQLVSLIAQKLDKILPNLETPTNPIPNPGNTIQDNTNHVDTKPSTHTPTKQTKKDNRKRKNLKRSHASTTLETPIPNKKQARGTYPLWNSCKFHHPTHTPCRICTNFDAYDHLAKTCRHTTKPRPEKPTTTTLFTKTNEWICSECNNPTHGPNQCPRLAMVIYDAGRPTHHTKEDWPFFSLKKN